MAALLHEAAEAEDPASALRDARVRLSGRREPRPEHDAWMVGLRFGGRADTPPGGVDWAAVLRENIRHPYASEAGIELTRHAGCPTELVYQAVRGGVGSFAGERLGPVPFAAVLPPEVPDERKLVDLLVWGIKGGRFAVDDVLREVTPAGAVLDALHRMSPRPAEAGAAGTTTAPSFAGSGAYRGHLPRALAPAVARLIEPLGDAPDAWNSLYKLAVRFPGTCRELVATAVEQAATARVNGTPVAWPRDLAARFPAEAPEGARRRLYGLLAAAPEHVQRAVIPALDLRAVQQLTVYYPLSAAVRAHIRDVLGTEAAVANAAHWEMPTDVVDALLDMNDPDVNASLYDFGAITQDERIRICAGRPRGGGDHTVPISSALVDLLARTSPSTRRNWLLAPLDSGSPELVRAMLGRTRLHTEVGRLRVAIGLWQRHGPDAVAALLDETDYPGRRPSAKHPFPPATHRALRTALAAATPEAGLASLRDALAAARTPEAVAHYLVDRPAKADERLEHFDAEYGIPLPWNYLVASDGEQPLPARLLAALAAQPGCPRHLLTAFLARTKLPARMLGMDWLPTALSEGRLLATDLLTLAAPAGAVVEYLTRDAPTGDAAAEHMAVPRTETLTLMAEAGFDPADAEHWAVAIRLLPDFTGTIPELLSTTAAIVR
ncbi:MAG TPA: hypothetical protein VLH10_16605 [Yinghuangia sp.]|nr:hypothetical protein [Yinghuangia sp.]